MRIFKIKTVEDALKEAFPEYKDKDEHIERLMDNYEALINQTNAISGERTIKLNPKKLHLDFLKCIVTAEKKLQAENTTLQAQTPKQP